MVRAFVRTRPTFLLTLFLAFVTLSMLADTSTHGQQVMTGIVIVWDVDELIVANGQTDPGGVRIALRDGVYERSPRAIEPGTRVTVWYRNVGERRPVADKVRADGKLRLR